MNHYNQLKEVLNNIFELNKADLDFGIYRIINQKRKQVNEFIDKQLPNDIKMALSNTQSTDKTEIENELKKLKKTLDEAGIVAEDSPKFKSLNERLQNIENTDVLEQEVFSHLANFFRRYYKDGDFISMRRYKKDVYAIPYEGEEVKLHWANHDQYYIKSSENFKNYTFKTADDKKVSFQLKEVSTEQNNNKTQGDAERRFAIYAELPVEENEGELIIHFVYEPVSKATKQETLLNEAVEILSQKIPSDFKKVFDLSPTEKNPKRTVLEKHLTDYVSKNSFDYFIHKDLGGFLARELDYYIKNEVLYLDDINTRQTEFFVAQLSKVKAIKGVAQKVIDFLAQIENFQKKLWLKKKFVLRTDYCITLDKIDAQFYPEIFQNQAQLKEWKTLFDVDILNAEQLVFEPFLVLDTQFFDETFKDRLLATFDNLDEITDGLLINSENFQALNIMLEKYHGKIQANYIDPPYNTSASEITYKNEFKNSTWISLIENRFNLARNLLKSCGILCVTIDDFELTNLFKLCDEIYGHSNHLATTPIRNNPQGRSTVKGFAVNHEYALFYSSCDENITVGRLDRTESQINRYNEIDNNGKRFLWENFRKTGTDSNREDRPKQFYPLVVNKTNVRVPKMEWNGTEWILQEEIENNESIFYPINENGVEKVWKWGFERVVATPNYIKVDKGEGNKLQIFRRNDLNENGALPSTWWDKPSYSASSHGTNLLTDLFGKNNSFSFPKSIYAVIDCLKVSNLESNEFALDYFAGSGTTGHATIKLNRADDGKRKYILVEMGTYFNTVTKPRIQKVIYSDNWKNGKPQDKGGISQIVKYQVLESYEDTLNNLYLKSPIAQGEMDFSEKAQEEYLLQYMLEMESREHLFNLEMFRKPFDYQLKVTENNELKPTKVDLVETFNYLIGLYVSKVQRVKDIKVVEGVTRTGIKTLVIWRDVDTTTHEDVEKLLRRFYDSQRTKEFQQIYINGDHHLENLRLEGDSFKIKLIEETFFKKMFNETEL